MKACVPKECRSRGKDAPRTLKNGGVISADEVGAATPWAWMPGLYFTSESVNRSEVVE